LELKMQRLMFGWVGLLLLGNPDPSGAQAKPEVRLAGSHFIALSVADLEASAHWYQDLFGLAVRSDMEADSNTRVRVLGSSNLPVELIADRRGRPRPGGNGDIALVHGFIKAGLFVCDISATMASLRGHGIFIEGQWLDSKPKNLLIRDPGGNAIQFFEQAIEDEPTVPACP
jgi:catechol 2,3-dioxygenase-like lactoylglutathione lyase family enzyme